MLSFSDIQTLPLFQKLAEKLSDELSKQNSDDCEEARIRLEKLSYQLKLWKYNHPTDEERQKIIEELHEATKDAYRLLAHT